MTVQVVSAGAWYAGSLAADGDWSQNVEMAGADLVLVGVCTQSLDDSLPRVTIGGTLLQPVGRPIVRNESNGVTLIGFALRNPPAGMLRIETAWWFGDVSVSFVALSGTSGDIGVRWSDTAVSDVTGTIGEGAMHASSTTVLLVSERYSSADLSVPEGWTIQASVNEAPAAGGRVGAHVVTGPSSSSCVVSAAPWAALDTIAFEVFEAGTALPEPDVSVVSAKVYDLGLIGGDTVTKTLAVPECDVLLLFVSRGFGTLPDLKVNGEPVEFTAHRLYPATNGLIALTAVNSPASGDIEITVSGYYGYYGPTMLAAVALAGATGQAGADGSHHAYGYAIRTPVESESVTGRLIGVGATYWRALPAVVPSFGLGQIAHQSSDLMNISVIAGDCRYDGALYIQQPQWQPTADMSVMCIELLAVPGPADVAGSGEMRMPAPMVAAQAAEAPPPARAMTFDVYYESYLEPPRDPALADMSFLARMPPYVRQIILSFANPLVTYAGLDDNLRDTTTLQFPGTARQLKAVLDLLRSRHPGIDVVLAITQTDGSAFIPEPYNPAGWGGLKPEHLDATRLFMADLGISSISLDYEIFSDELTLETHCWTDENGVRQCYTDRELTDVIKMYRAAFPREDGHRIYWTPPGVAAYFDEYYENHPVGWNSGYGAGLKRDAEALAALDGMHLMTYDATAGFDPVRAVEAFRHHFPDTPIYIGLRAGPREWGDPTQGEAFAGRKQTLTDVLEYINSANVLGASGAFMWSHLWDTYDPSGDRTHDWPGPDMIAQLVARHWSLPRPDLPLVSDGTMPALILTHCNEDDDDE